MESIQQLASTCRIATARDDVYHSECVYTFHNPYSTELGIVVNLNTFIGTIDRLAIDQEGKEGLFLRIVKTRREIPKEEQKKDKDSSTCVGSTTAVTKLGYGIEGGFPDPSSSSSLTLEETKYSVVMLRMDQGQVQKLVEIPYEEKNKLDFPMNISSSVDSIICHAGAAIKHDLQAFELEEEKPISKYADSIDFVENGVIISPNPTEWKCGKTGATDNLWLNLSTGFIGGGRRNWDGSGGSNGALDHYIETGERYPLVVKLGTITEDIDTADCYSYAKDEDGPVKIPNLAELLKKRGIHVSGMYVSYCSFFCNVNFCFVLPLTMPH